MTAPMREPVDWFVGTIEAVAASAQVMSSEAFKRLPTYLASDRYVPAEIVDENTGRYESIRIVGANGTSTASVVRGVEGTTALTWEGQNTIRCSPTTRDVLQTYTNYGDENYTDQHLGARYTVASQKVVRERTSRQGGMPHLIADPSDFWSDINTPYTLGAIDLLPRMKAIAIAPSVTPPSGVIEILTDGSVPSTPGLTYYTVNTGGTGLFTICGAIFCPYLSGSDSSWRGDCAVVFSYYPGAQRVSVKFFDVNGNPFASKQVRGTLILFGR